MRKPCINCRWYADHPSRPSICMNPRNIDLDATQRSDRLDQFVAPDMPGKPPVFLYSPRALRRIWPVFAWYSDWCGRQGRWWEPGR
jgi:hypothetical protein